MILVWSHGWPIYTRFDLCTCWYTRFNFRTCVTHDLIFVRDVSPNLILYVLLHTIWFLYLIFVRAFTGTHDLIYIRDFTHDLIYVRGFTRFDCTCCYTRFDFVSYPPYDHCTCYTRLIIVRVCTRYIARAVTHDYLCTCCCTLILSVFSTPDLSFVRVDTHDLILSVLQTID